MLCFIYEVLSILYTYKSHNSRENCIEITERIRFINLNQNRYPLAVHIVCDAWIEDERYHLSTIVGVWRNQRGSHAAYESKNEHSNDLTAKLQLFAEFLIIHINYIVRISIYVTLYTSSHDFLSYNTT